MTFGVGALCTRPFPLPEPFRNFVLSAPRPDPLGVDSLLGGRFATGAEAPPIVLPSTGVKADVYLQCLTTLVMGGNGLSRPGGNLGFRV